MTARHDSYGYRVAKFVRRHSWEVAASVLVVGSLTGVIVANTRQARRAESESAKTAQVNQFLSVRETLARSYHGLGLYNESERQLRLSLATHRQLRRGDHADIPRTLSGLASAHLNGGVIARAPVRCVARCWRSDVGFRRLLAES